MIRNMHVFSKLFLLVLMVFGTTSAWGQTDYSGTYYIASGGKSSANGNKYTYDSSNPGNNYYLCPTEGWCYYQATDDFTSTDNGMPFLTTYHCRDGVYDASKAVWIIEKAPAPNSAYYYIKQKSTGRYLVSNGQIRTTDNPDRIRVHLETIANPSTEGDKVLFEFNSPSSTYIEISPKGITDGKMDNIHKDHDRHKWLTVNNGNYTNLVGNSGKTGGPTGHENTCGIICLYSAGDANAPFYLEDVPIPTPTFTVNADGTVEISCSEAGTVIYYTLDGTDPTTSSTAYSSALPSLDVLAASSVKAIAVRTIGSQTSPVATLPVVTYNYHIVNVAGNVVATGTEKHPAGYPLTSGYSNIPTALSSPYISDETIKFYAMEGVFNASNLDEEHHITATPTEGTHIYITYTTTHLGSKFVKLSGSSPYNIKNSSGQYLYHNGSHANGSPVTAETNSATNAEAYVINNNQLWYFSGNDPYDLKIKNAESSTLYLTTSSSAPTWSDASVSFVLTGQSDGADASHKSITLKNLANGETVTLAVNTVVLPRSYTLIDMTKNVIVRNLQYDENDGFILPEEWRSPLVDYHYWNANAFTQATAGTPDEPFVFVTPAPTEITSATQVTSNNVIYVTYTLKADNTIDLDGRNLLNDPGKGVGTTYMMQFSGGASFNQEDGSDGVMGATRKAVYPYSNGDCALYVYGNERWEEQLASGASTRTRWLWYLEPSKSVLDPYHVRVSSYQTQTSYKIDDNNTRNFHSYLWTYKPEGYSEVVTGVTNNNPLVHGGSASDPAVTALPEGSEYMLLGTSTSSLKLVTYHEITGGATNGTYGTRQTVHSLEQYWKNNPTVQAQLSTKVTAVGRNVELTSTQKSELPSGWHSYQAWANSAPWVHNNDASAGKAPTTTKKFLEEEHVFQTIEMGASFQLVPTEIKPMLILLDQHGWEIARLPLPSGPDDPNRAARYADIHKYSSPMVARYHFWKTGSKMPGYHKFKVSNYATVSDVNLTEYTADELGRADLAHSTPNLPNYETQAFVGGKERDWYVTYDVKPEYANTYAGAATKAETSAAPFLLKQGDKYAQIDGTSINRVDAPASLESVPESMKWYVRPNFDIDEEMGYIYDQDEAESKDDTELHDYVDPSRLTPYWSNGFDPYNIQIQSVSNTARYFTANTTGSTVSSAWSGTSSSISLQNLGEKQAGVAGLDQTNMKITNATFMVVDDGNGNMRLMPRFDHTKVMQTFTTLATQAAAAPANNNGVGDQSLYLTMVPKVVSSSSEITAMGGHYVLASNFTASGSIGTKDSPFTGVIEGQIDRSFNVSEPFIAYAEDAVIKNVIIESSSVSSGNVDGHAGAIVATALGNTRIYNCGVNGGSVSGSENVGGIVGRLDGYSRVINCYSYANITGGTDVGGIVGYNAFASTQANLHTMVMNCMFYGDITGGSRKSPIYGGQIINNLNSGGLNTFNYYSYDDLEHGVTDGKYNCALAVENKNLTRFEFYRLLLNSNKKLAAIYATGDAANANQMAKWVLETADRDNDDPKPYPVLKAQGYYPSIINYDTTNAPDSSFVGRNNGGKLGKTLSVTISQASNAPSGALISTDYLEIERMDKDTLRYNYNYDKIQLPYYNDVGSGNYTKAGPLATDKCKVVTGWKITGMTGGTAGTYTAADAFGGYNFADRNCTSKDLYGTSGRVFSQGAYFDVPYGVTAITIEPYWGNAAFVADAYYDVVYNTSYGAENVTMLGTQVGNNTTYNGQKVYSTINDALGTLGNATVYDNAIVLVGNLHQNNVPSGGDKAFTVMSVDEDHDNEPDYSMIYHHTGRTTISPIRFDFINIPGTAQAQKPKDGTDVRNFTIFKTKGWFETTNTCLVYSNQVEYENLKSVSKKANSPLILLGGDFEQFVSTQSDSVYGRTNYIHVGSNVHIQSFGLGTHGDGSKSTPHIPVSVTGGAFDKFYLSGTYNQDVNVRRNDNAECYVSGGYFKEAAGACQEQIDGDVHWQIYNADIDAFFGGGINAARPITGHVTTDIYNSHVTLFCGGPKFGDMQSGKKVTTTAEGCVFGKFFGGGYGGTSYSRKKYYDSQSTSWTSWSNQFGTDRGKYFDGVKTGAGGSGGTQYGYKGIGVATDFEYEFFVWSTGGTGGRLYVNFASFSLATCNDVESNLKGCTITNDFYGGGSYGEVKGKATSVLDGCTVQGSVFGGGYSATLPTLRTRMGLFDREPNFNASSGMFEPGKISENTIECEWRNATQEGMTLSNNTSGSHLTGDTPYYICTDVDLDNLGKVGATDLTIKGNTSVAGRVYGGGDMSAVTPDPDYSDKTIKGDTKVHIQNAGGNTIPYVYGGGNTADVDGDTEVNMTSGTVNHDIYGGGRGETTIVGGNVTVNIGSKTGVELSGTGLVLGDVYGGSAFGKVNTTADKNTFVNVYAGTVNGRVFGGGLGQAAADAVAASGTPGDPGYVPAKDAVPAIVAENQGNTTVNIEGGQVKTAVYGGSNVNGVLTKDAVVTIIGGTVGTTPMPTPLPDVVFGGGKGEPTLVNGDVTVNIGTKSDAEPAVYTGAATIHGNVYGGSALGNTNASKPASVLVFNDTKKTRVYLYGGTINGNVFGGGLGQKTGENGATSDIVSYVGGDVNVLLDGAKLNTASGMGQIFGCNNLNGTPKGHVKVHVKRTVNTDPVKNAYKSNSATALADRTTYDVNAVYGGGNKADYNPTKATGSDDDKKEAFSEVLIEGCDATSIQYVYGGGNAAAVPATQVTIESAYIIDQLFGGGNGAGAGNPGADVGIIDKTAYAADPETGIYGTGKAVTKLKGGQIHVLYGGSNTLGNVRRGTELERKESSECALKIGEIYGAGQVAPMDGDVNIILECMPEDFVPQVFGGAKNATINGKVSLTVTSGKFGRVFGGNNEGGSINGSITVNAYEDGCQPLIIGELYGGGFNAPYSIWGCNDDGGTWVPNTRAGDPYVATDADAVQVYVFSCTSIGKVFGGGFGKKAQVVGNTHVWVNTMQGIVNGTKQEYPSASGVYIGKIGQIFGGGNAAPVHGNVTMDIGTATVPEPEPGQELEKIGIRLESGTYMSPSADRDTTITAGIYGGGFSADVDGDVTMNIGTVNQNQGINIGGDIFGGGFGETTTVSGDVVMNIGKRTNTALEGDPVYVYEGYATITGDVYGGSAKGKVNATKGGTVESPTYTATAGKATQVNLYGGTINGNLYGGGLGEATHAADVYGAVTVNVEGGSVTNVFGCNNVLGTPKSTVAVNIDGGAISQSVYGGGNQAVMDGSPVVTVTGGTIGTPDLGGAVYGNVYGGGLGNNGTGALTDFEKAKAGLVKGNTEINISGGSILHNIYGGGAYGSVGTYTYNESTGVIESRTSGGKATIRITGGTIGTNGHENGMVFGASRGDVDRPESIHDKLAWVYDTEVTIGTSGEGHGTEAPEPQIKGSVYGSGENGHTLHDAAVTIHSGKIGITEELDSDPVGQKGAYYPYRGNVYGAGCGTDKYYANPADETHDGNGTLYNVKAGIVGHDATVTIDGGHVVRNVYGGGAMGSVTGKTTVNISGKSVIGADGSGGGYVYTAARGNDDMPAGYASVGSTELNISGGTIWGSAFGGGQLGTVKGNVDVTVSGGFVKEDVYGGGALANTNTDNWNTAGSAFKYVAVTPAPTVGTTPVGGYYTESGGIYTLVPNGSAVDGKTYYKKQVVGDWIDTHPYKTTVVLTGGVIGNAYGGGLGSSTVAANVYGDVKVTVNKPEEMSSTSGTGIAFTRRTVNVTFGGKEYIVPVTGRVFGCNNINGTPTGNVRVEVYATRQIEFDDHDNYTLYPISGVDAEHSPNNHNKYYEVQAVYGGGNLSDYLPAAGSSTSVYIGECDVTSIEKVYGGGNSAVVPSSFVTINGSFDIGTAFGGGNGGDLIQRDGVWHENDGAIVIGTSLMKPKGGKVGEVFGGSDAKGFCGNPQIDKTESNLDCPLKITRMYGAGKESDVDHVDITISSCSGDNEYIEYVFGGSYNAHIAHDVNITITAGVFKNVFGGNDRTGSIGGNITVNIEETESCKPIIIQNLLGGGNEAPYPGKRRDGTEIDTSGKITVNVKSATRIDNIFGGSFKSDVNGDTEVNINMTKGFWAGKTYNGELIPDSVGLIGNIYGGGNQGIVRGNSTVNIATETTVDFKTEPTSLGTKATGEQTLETEGVAYIKNLDGTFKTKVLGARIRGDIFGGGHDANVNGDATVNICTADYSGFSGFQGVSIDKSSTGGGTVYGGGYSADVLGNTNVTVSGGYVYNGIFGGGYSGSVGTFTRSTVAADANIFGHPSHQGDCIGKPVSCATGTGKCTVVVNGHAQIGPVTVASVGMPVSQGWVWGGGCGLIEDPAKYPDTHFKTYVNETDVTIGGNAFIMEGVLGGGEFGRVLGNTLVKIQDDCQIGVGENQIITEGGINKPKRYTTPQWTEAAAAVAAGDASRINAIAAAMPECRHWDYESPFETYDPFFKKYSSPSTFAPANTDHPTNGKTWIGVVFGGGSGYMPYEKEDGSGYDWCSSAGWVEHNAEVRISGGHILTNAYGGNEITGVGGSCTVTMTGGTIGLPRTLAQIAAHPVTCYLFGGGMGDQRPHFNTYTSVGSAVVNVSGGIIFGSVFGGAEDGQVSGNTSVTISQGATFTVGETSITTGPIIGTWGTSYVDGNIFGGGRGFSGETLGAGNVFGNVTVNVTGGTMRGSIYGGGRLASVGTNFSSLQDPTSGQFIEGNDHGYVTINISGGTIGNATESALIATEGHAYDHTKGGNVFGGSMGRLEYLSGAPNPLWTRLAQTKSSTINISGGTIKSNVYGGSEYGTTRDDATISISGGTIDGHVYGGGYGSDEQRAAYNSTIIAGTSPNTKTYLFSPLQYAGCLGGDSYVNVSGGHVKGNVYGGGEMASVGVIDYEIDGNAYETDGSIHYKTVVEHSSISTDGTETFYNFGLSWPYEFTYLQGGKTNVSITGTAQVDNYVFGGGRGKVSFGATDDIAAHRYKEAHLANVRETEVTIGTSGGSDDPNVRSIYGGAEDGHVNENAKITIYRGTIRHSVFGAGKGTDKYTTYLLDSSEGENQGKPKATTDLIYSWTAGKVYGNTEVIMHNGSVGWFIYGGGNMASVGKGNYAGGVDDYAPGGYGELPSADGPLWTNTNFTNSGHTTVTIMGGTVGAESGLEDGVPKGSVFGGSRGLTAMAEVLQTPRYKYVPSFFLGYVNKTTVNIGGFIEGSDTTIAVSGPDIMGSIYGGGQDGHVRNSTEVRIFKGDVKGQTGEAADRSGCVFGAGSGIGTYSPDGVHNYCNSSSGSVTCTTLVEVRGTEGTTKIKGSVYGGGALASVGPPNMGQSPNEQKAPSVGHQSHSYCKVDIYGGSIGGSVFGAGRGPGSTMFPGTFTGVSTAVDATADKYNPTMFATAIWTDVNIKGGTIGKNVYGGGEMGRVKESTEVNLTGGTIAHDAFGGGKGTQGTYAIPAMVLGNTTVKLNEGKTASSNGCIVERVFGCNDQNGTPKGHVLVHVYATQHKGTTQIVPAVGKYAKFKSMEGGYTITNYTDNTNANDLKKLATTVGMTADEIKVYEDAIAGGADDHAKKAALTTYIDSIAYKKYDVLAVYGGGNLAMYEPTASNQNTEVIIDGCDLTSIYQVYGGGNAASTPANLVRINAAYEIHEAFGGGNGKDSYEMDGKWYENHGANVGYKATFESDKSDPLKGTRANPYPAVAIAEVDTPEERRANTSYHYGKGTVELDVTGGRVHKTYGGSNTKGNIRQTVITNTEDAGVCTLAIDASYPAGKNADTDGETRLNGSCVEYQGAIYGGAQDANVYSDVVIDITNGHYGAIYGGNNTSGKIYGSITINVHESGCKPIIIDELYGGGYNADYSIYGYNNDGTARTKAQYNALTPEQKAQITVQRDPQINIISATRIGKIYGGGYNAKVIGSPSVNVNMENGYVTSKYVTATPAAFNEGYHSETDHGVDCSYYVEKIEDGKAILRTGTIGTIYGGGSKGDIQGNTSVEIGTGEWLNFDGERETIAPARKQAAITGNVFGGGEGLAEETGPDAFTCAKAMVGVVDSGEGSTSVTIGNALIRGSVYGGGEMGRVENNTSVTIGVENNTTDTVTVKGSVYGGGQGVETHGYSGLTRGNSTVYVQGKSKVLGSVYGGGESATVGRYWVNTTPLADGAPEVPEGTPSGAPYATRSGGLCTVTIRDDAEIGPDDMVMVKAVGSPDNTGHVFGASRGVLPTDYTYTDNAHKPWHIDGTGTKVWSNEEAYLQYLETLGLASSTEVTVSENAFVKGDVFGGAEQGFVQANTHVIIEGNCQIGNGYVQMDADGNYLVSKKSVNRRYTNDEWTAGHLIDPLKDGTLAAATGYTSSLPECASWYYQSPYEVHDIYADRYDSEGGALTATNGYTFFGNVFGGGSGYLPYAPGKWHWKSGNVGGNTVVDINGGHILTNVYGANETTSVGGKATVTMTAGTIGVPRTVGQIIKHPVTCYLFGGGAGDQRVIFNKQTNVKDVEVSVTGGRVYGSVFGGGEDGHVLRNVDVTIGGTAKIGTWGTTYVDGNVFGGGRGFAGDAYTAGNVAGSVNMTISGGEILGSVYGGGRLGSVGYGLYDETETDGDNKYGVMQDDGYGDYYIKNASYTRDEIEGFKRGHIEINITGGTIGNTNEFIFPTPADPEAGITGNIPDGVPADFKTWSDAHWTAWKKHNNVSLTEYDPANGRVTHTKGGNVFAGGMGRRVQLDGETEITAIDWRKLGNVKSTKLTISGSDIWVMGNVYGGGEFGSVTGYHNQLDGSGNPIIVAERNLVTGTEITVQGGAIIGTEVTGATPVKETVSVPVVGNSNVKYTYGSVYGGGMGTKEHYRSTTDHAGEVRDSTMITISDAATCVRASVFGGGEIAVVRGNTNVTINNGIIGRNEVRNANDANAGYVMFGSSTMGNVYGGGMGVLDHTNAGQVMGNTKVTIRDGYIYHNVYGGGALASVGTYGVSTGTVPAYILMAGIPYDWADNTGTAIVTITGGTIGINGRDNGMVNGSSRGGIEKPTGSPAIDRFDKLAWVKNAVVTIGEASGESAGPHIKGSVYGGGENGHNSGDATVTVNRGVIGIVDTSDPWYDFIPNGLSNTDPSYAAFESINKKALITRGNVYGAGCGTDTYTGDDGKEYHNVKSGMVAGNSFVNIKGGHVGHSVYGGGSMGSVGTIVNATDTVSTAKHTNENTSFALSWPYKFVFAPNTGKATVNITGGHIGTYQQDGGDVFGASRGEAGDRYVTAHLAFVNETEVNISYPSTADMPDEATIQNDASIPCITGSVHGSGEDGYVYGDAHVTLNEGLIGHSLYGGGKGKGTYPVTLNKIVGGGTYTANIYSLLSGRVMGNTYVTMNGGRVGRNVYGGGNMASVGKGNYAGSTVDDYSKTGYGELITSKLWESDSEGDDAWEFLNSGKTDVKVFAGIVGYIDATNPKNSFKNNMPYGNVFGGSAGEPAPNVPVGLIPRYYYSPAFFSGYVNQTKVNIGGYRCKTAHDSYEVGAILTANEFNELIGDGNKAKWERVGPRIYASIYGGGQDGHVRRDTWVVIDSCEVGLPYTAANRTLLQTSDVDNGQWLHRGNVYGAGSGINEYSFDFNNDGKISGEVKIGDVKYKEKYYSTSAGSVAFSTRVDVRGGTIYRNVLGGGSFASVGPPKITQTDYAERKTDTAADWGRQSLNLVNIGGAKNPDGSPIMVRIGEAKGVSAGYGGHVFGGSRGDASLGSDFGSSIWTEVNVKDGAIIFGDVFGGGNAGEVMKDTDVKIGTTE